jgi:hypothetical protein
MTTNDAFSTTIGLASSWRDSVVLGGVVALLFRLDASSLEQWTWGAGVAWAREYGQFYAGRYGMLCRSSHHLYHCRSNHFGKVRSSVASAPHHWPGTRHMYGSYDYRCFCERVKSRTMHLNGGPATQSVNSEG